MTNGDDPPRASPSRAASRSIYKGPLDVESLRSALTPRTVAEQADDDARE